MSYLELLPAAEARPDNPAWHELRRAGVSASAIAAVLGISPWESPFSLYWRKVNGWDNDDAVNELTRTGSHLEDAIAEWWADEQDPHESLAIFRAGLYASSERPWQLATPDRLVYMACAYCCGAGVEEMNAGPPRPCPDCKGWKTEGPGPLALLECKWVAHSWDGWGEPGTDEIPVYYRAQALWQADVLEVDEVHLAALGPGGFRAYRIRRDDKDIRVMRAAGERFMRRLDHGDPPDVDEHAATVTALKKLHPTLEDYDVEVPLELAEGYRRARALRQRVEARVDAYEARIRAAIGGGRRAVCNKKLVASRSVYDKSSDEAELTALETDWPVVDRLNPGRSASYAS